MARLRHLLSTLYETLMAEFGHHALTSLDQPAVIVSVALQKVTAFSSDGL
jgi:hypothetical protein